MSHILNLAMPQDLPACINVTHVAKCIYPGGPGDKASVVEGLEVNGDKVRSALVYRIILAQGQFCLELQ